MMELEEHDVVRHPVGLPNEHVPPGAVGAVVMTFPGSNPVVVEVEFVDDDGATIAVTTVLASQLELVSQHR